MCSGTCPRSPGIFRGHLGLLSLPHPRIKLVSKFSCSSCFSIAVAASQPRALSLGASLDSLAVWGEHKAWQAQGQLTASGCSRLLPLCGSGLPFISCPHIYPSSSRTSASSCSLCQLQAEPPSSGFSTTALPPPPAPSSGFN